MHINKYIDLSTKRKRHIDRQPDINQTDPPNPTTTNSPWGKKREKNFSDDKYISRRNFERTPLRCKSDSQDIPPLIGVRRTRCAFLPSSFSLVRPRSQWRLPSSRVPSSIKIPLYLLLSSPSARPGETHTLHFVSPDEIRLGKDNPERGFHAPKDSVDERTTFFLRWRILAGKSGGRKAAAPNLLLSLFLFPFVSLSLSLIAAGTSNWELNSCARRGEKERKRERKARGREIDR